MCNWKKAAPWCLGTQFWLWWVLRCQIRTMCLVPRCRNAAWLTSKLKHLKKMWGTTTISNLALCCTWRFKIIEALQIFMCPQIWKWWVLSMCSAQCFKMMESLKCIVVQPVSDRGTWTLAVKSDLKRSLHSDVREVIRILDTHVSIFLNSLFKWLFFFLFFFFRFKRYY